MIQCPRCQNTIDETKRTACPVCLAPLAAPGAPQTTAAPGGPLPYGAPAAQAGQPAPARPYTPPTGAPYGAPSAQAYPPQPGAPYVTPPLPGAPPAVPPLPGTVPQGAPGYAAAPQTRTTLTGEVVPVSTPSPAPPRSYAGGNPAPSGAAAYGSGSPHALSYNQPAPAAKSGGSWWNWRIAGGGALGGTYIVIRLILIIMRAMTPHHSSYDYSYQPPSSSYSSFGGSTATQPAPSYTPPIPPSQFHSSLPAPPRPGGFYGPSGMPGRGSFGNPYGNR